MEKLIIVGDGETAEMAYEYLSELYQIIGFAVEKEFKKDDAKFGIPVYSLDEMFSKFNPNEIVCFVAISYNQRNKLRERLYLTVKSKNYKCISFIHPSAQVSPFIDSLGDNCFILENCVLQRKAKIGDNVIIWSNSTVAHQSTIANHSFLASNTVISGFCAIGERNFIGAGAILKDYITTGDDTLVGAGAVVVKNISSNCVVIGNPAKQIQ